MDRRVLVACYSRGGTTPGDSLEARARAAAGSSSGLARRVRHILPEREVRHEAAVVHREPSRRGKKGLAD